MGLFLMALCQNSLELLKHLHIYGYIYGHIAFPICMSSNAQQCYAVYNIFG